LWFVCRETGSRLYRADQMEALAKRIASAFDLGGDSLDTVELVMELDSEYEIRISEDDAKRVATMEGAMSYLREHLSRD
jgi:acyl carrier protein